MPDVPGARLAACSLAAPLPARRARAACSALAQRNMLGLRRCGLDGGCGMTGAFREGAPVSCPPRRQDRSPRRWPYVNAQSFGPYDSTVPTARTHTRVVLAEWGLAHVSPAAELVLSELVTNALQATWRLGMHTPVSVRLLADHSWLVVEVWDGVQAAPVLREPDTANELDGDEADGHGNGLMIVATMCHRWGFFRRPEGGKVVYAIFALQEP
jgi:anti-sigma regulatory factor (Ser/Thr protein kinase)